MEKRWVKSYDSCMSESNTYPEKTLYEMLCRSEEVFPKKIAVSFEGTHISYHSLRLAVDSFACAMHSLGIEKGTVVTICLPNIPQAVVAFYAINKLGAISNMVHPKTPAAELKTFMSTTDSEHLIILDAFLSKSAAMLHDFGPKSVIVCSISDYLNPVKSVGFYLSSGRKIKPVPEDAFYIRYRTLYAQGEAITGKSDASNSKTPYIAPISHLDAACYLHSGGTTGAPKTIVLSSANMNVLGVNGFQIINIPDPFTHVDTHPDIAMMTILPLFHGFGLCMGLHTMICNAITALLVPIFTPDSFAKVILRDRPALLAAVPTLYEGMMKSTKLAKADLSFLHAAFCGGDSLSPDLKSRFEEFIRNRGAKITLREGYGLTETVTVCAVNPNENSKPGSVGLPLPDICMEVVKPGTEEILAPGEKGEICVSGPTTMLMYLHDDEATKEAIHRHADGLDWVHTGDFGYMDEDGYFFFEQRIKRIIKVSGVPVFPSQIEAVLSSVPGIDAACAIAIPHAYRIHVVKALCIAAADAPSQEELIEAMRATCETNLISYARPTEYEFRTSFPKTLVGKIDYVKLEAEENEKREAPVQ